jgi:dolichol-phosphate mannosyltransferase
VNGKAAPAAPLVTLVIPTKEEAANIAPLLERLRPVVDAVPVEVLFVDDSDDETAERIRELGADYPAEVHVLHRERDARKGGLATAVVEGFARARGSWFCVMDADLQHPPEEILSLLSRAQQGDVDIVVASRFADGGSAEDFGRVRSLLSQGSSALARLGFRRALRGVTDPMSGFFLIGRSVVDTGRLRPRGFKILLELLVRTPALRKGEVPFVFGERNAGRSKASLTEAVNYLLHLWQLRLSGSPSRFIRFGLVGLSGLLVNTLLLAALTERAHLYYLLAAIVATQGSTIWNFVLAERLVFNEATPARGRLARFLQFAVVNNLLLLLRGPVMFGLTSGLHVMYLVSNVLTLLGLSVARFALADTWIWGAAKPIAGRRYYDLHGLVTVASDVGLPELERFGVPHVAGEPTVDVTIGTVSAAGAGKKSVWIERDRFIYDEGLGSYGFGVDIRAGRTISIVASRLLRRSPHVLYTNVVEPVLRWHFAELGYALVHAACISSGDEAFLVTARTDTGKTTTILKSLDANPTLGFLSDDLTLLAPDGTVLTYPKPLTVSRHTVSAVKTPLLSWKERLALVFQSRLHSKSGRAFAFFLSRHNLPVATINAIVQLLVPPPKYHVERLVPDVNRVRQAGYERLVVIQHGDEFVRPLDGNEAVEILLANCADAYGFPPYAHLEQFLHERADTDLAAAEAALISQVISGKPATLLSNSRRDWYLSLPEILGLPPVSSRTEETEPELQEQLLLNLPRGGELAAELGAD